MTPLTTTSLADSYFENIVGSQLWDDAEDPLKLRALCHATKILNTLNWVGVPDAWDQENCFPRHGLLSGSSQVPQDVQEACCDIALALLNDINPDESIEDIAVTSQSYSSIRVSYDRSMVQEHIAAGVPSATAWKKIKPYLLEPGLIRMTRVN